MSYTIVYDRRFIKCGDLYSPMALYGERDKAAKPVPKTKQTPAHVVGR